MFWSTLNDFPRDDWFNAAWDNMRRLQEEMNRVLEVASPREYPPIQLWSNDEKAVVLAEVPGVDGGTLDVSVMGDVLTIGGERRPEDLEENSRFLRRERGTGRFTRTIQLPFSINTQKVEAECRNGILKVTLPRAEAEKPRRIAIK